MVVIMAVIVVAMIVMGVIVMGVIVMGVIVMGVRCVRVAVAMRVVMVMVELVAAGVARMRARQGDQPGKDRADQRQENKSLDHSWLSPSSD